MATTFNQIPPIKAGAIYYDVVLGDLMFFRQPEPDEDGKCPLHKIKVYRNGSLLVVYAYGYKFSKQFPDHDDTVDVFLHACYEMIDEVLPRLSQK